MPSDAPPDHAPGCRRRPDREGPVSYRTRGCRAPSRATVCGSGCASPPGRSSRAHPRAEPDAGWSPCPHRSPLSWTATAGASRAGGRTPSCSPLRPAYRSKPAISGTDLAACHPSGAARLPTLPRLCRPPCRRGNPGSADRCHHQGSDGPPRPRKCPGSDGPPEHASLARDVVIAERLARMVEAAGMTAAPGGCSDRPSTATGGERQR